MSNFNRNDWTQFLSKKKEQKRQKFGSKKIIIDGITFDSKKEGQRYMQLRLLEKANKIKKLKWQVPFELKVRKFEVNGDLVDIGYWFMNRYIADFTYYDQSGNYVVEDVKSEATRKLRPYKLKKRLMKIVYGLEIKEV